MTRTHTGNPPFPNAPNISAILNWQATRLPDTIAFTFLDHGEREAGTVTYSALERRARTIAAVLCEKGLSGKRVILAYPSGLEFIAALFGCFYAGAIAAPAPLATRGSAFARVHAIVADANAAAVLSQRSLLQRELERSGSHSTAPDSKLPWIATDEIADSNIGFDRCADADDLAMLQYTSGSTGDPRGVMLTHANLIHHQKVLADALALTPKDICVNWLPLYHDMGLIGGVLHAVCIGVSCYVMPPLSFLQNPLRWLRAMSRYRGTISMAPSFAYELCARRARRRSEEIFDLSSWRVAICGGEPIRPQALLDFTESLEPSGFDARAFLPAYGLAEATLLATASTAGGGMITQPLKTAQGAEAAHFSAAPTRQVVCCGYPREGQRVAVVDVASRRRLAAGQTGEIWLQGASVAAGYWNRPAETAESFNATLTDDPAAAAWLRTGDLGFLSADGLVVTGRHKEVIIVRGVNYDPCDLETAARESDAALASGFGGAFSLDLEGGEAVVLVHEIGRDTLKSIEPNMTAGRIAEAISRNLGLTLHDVVLLRPGSLPRTTSGKIQRHVCRQQYLAGELATIGPVDHPALGKHRPHAAAFA